MTTIVGVLRANSVVLCGDGQVSLGNNVVKASAKKVRRIHDGTVICGFAGSTADALTLFDKLEAKLGEYSGNLPRAAVELAKEWRSDKYLRRLEAILLAGDKDRILMISGSGDVIEPDEGVVAIGSGGFYALAAARALTRHTEMSAHEIAQSALLIAAEVCVFTNDRLTTEEITS